MNLHRAFADQAFSRAAGAPLIPGNRLRLLRDGKENYPAWLAAIAAAKETIHFECYIIHDDATGREFVEALAAKATQGVRVRIIYDWFGALGAASFWFWRSLRRAGAEVRCFNPPHLDSLFSWFARDHRKMLAVDGRIAFVSGLCVGNAWLGTPTREAWRDTGVEVSGPAVVEVEQAFAAAWAATGPPLSREEYPHHRPGLEQHAGDVSLRVVATTPSSAGLYRVDQLVCAIARRSIWLTDAYFAGTTVYVNSLIAAARDGVDVRLLVPRSSDIPGMRAVARAGFRGLLEAGVRIFEWTGPMLHAKTAVADGRWARVGSTNLNLVSWIGNWELDLVAEDEGFAKEMEAMFLLDLEHSVEIVLTPGRRAHSRVRPAARRSRPRRTRAGTAAGVLRVGNAVGAALTNHRVLGAAEAKIMFFGAVVLFALAAVAWKWPAAVAAPVCVLAAWTALSLLYKAWRLTRSRNG